jgi:hypothetical protein
MNCAGSQRHHVTSAARPDPHPGQPDRSHPQIPPRKLTSAGRNHPSATQLPEEDATYKLGGPGADVPWGVPGSRRRHQATRALGALAAAVTVVLVGSCAGHPAAAPAPATGSATGSALGSATRPPTTDAATRLVVIGDSLSTGFATPGDPWTRQARSLFTARGQHVQITNASENGAGYVAPGDNGNVFLDLVNRAVVAQAQIVVVFGSDNDVGQAGLAPAITQTLQRVRDLAPPLCSSWGRRRSRPTPASTSPPSATSSPPPPRRSVGTSSTRSPSAGSKAPPASSSPTTANTPTPTASSTSPDRSSTPSDPSSSGEPHRTTTAHRRWLPYTAPRHRPAPAPQADDLTASTGRANGLCISDPSATASGQWSAAAPQAEKRH